MKRFWLLLLVVGLVFGVVGMAGAKCTSKTIFACTATNGKQVEVCDNGDTLEYSFGKSLAKPEKKFSINRSEASTYQYSGMGRYMTYSVEMPTGDTTYSVFTSADKLEPKSETGLNVTVKGKTVATIKCNEKKKMTVDLEGINLKPAE
jgi:hypothetical protein